VFKYVRLNERCPADGFLGDIQKPMAKRFKGQFDALTKIGEKFCNQQRFWPLRDHGKPLWEFKEHDHRLYCVRKISRNGSMTIVLLNGWIKGKEGKTDKEAREIDKALTLYNEFLVEFPGGEL
jgi:hypothetical protein